MIRTIPSASSALTFEELISRLSAHDAMEGLVVIGSATRDWASGPVIGDEFDEFLTGEVVTETAVGDGLAKTAFYEGAIHVISGDAARARVKVVWTLATIVSTESRFGMAWLHDVPACPAL